MHSENQQAVVERLIDEFRLQEGNYDVTNVNPALVDHIPTEQDMGKVYMRLVLSTLYSWEDLQMLFYVYIMIKYAVR